MSRFLQLGDPKDETLAALYSDMLDKGFGQDQPINWLTSQATRPDILAGTWAFSKGMLLEGELPMMVKQMIATTISSRNNCNYCRDLHGNVLSRLGVSEAMINSCVSDPELHAVPQPHRAILQFAVKVSQSPAKTDSDDLAQLEEQGLTRSEVLEIIALAAYCNFINTWADISLVRTESGSDGDD